MMSVKIVDDVFPARIIFAAPNVFDNVADLVLPVDDEPTSVPEGTYYIQICRVVVTNSEVVVAVENDDGVQIVFRDLVGSFETDGFGFKRLVTASGRMLVFKKESNCGCGARLTSWNAYKTLGATLGG